MSPAFPSEPFSRRQFVRRAGSATAWLGAVACLRPTSADAATAVEKNPFAYDVSRFSRTDPQQIAWTEVSRQACPVRATRRLAVGADGVLAVAAGQQLVWLRAGEWRSSADLGGRVGAAAALADGTWLVALRDRVLTVDAAGTRRTAWEPLGGKSWLTAITVAGDDVWVADAGQRVLLRYDRAGKLLARVGAKAADGTAPGFVLPSPFLDVRMHPDGLLRVNNPGRHRIEAYTRDGHCEQFWGEPSAAIAGFCGCCNPIALALLPDGRIVTGEKGLPRVKVYRADGSFESVVAGPETFPENARRGADPEDRSRWGLDVAVDPAGRIAVLDRLTAEVRLYQPKRT